MTPFTTVVFPAEEFVTLLVLGVGRTESVSLSSLEDEELDSEDAETKNYISDQKKQKSKRYTQLITYMYTHTKTAICSHW